MHLLPNNALSRLLYKNLLDEKEKKKNHVVLLQGVPKRMHTELGYLSRRSTTLDLASEKLNLPHLQNQLQAN